MPSFVQQLKLLLWKNWILRKRHKVRVFMEFVWPLILFLVLMWVRTRGLKQHQPSCHLVEKALPSVGGFEFIQNYFCTLNNTCHKDYVEIEGENVWSKSLFMQLINEATPLLTDILSSTEGTDTVSALWQDVNNFMKITSGFSTKEHAHHIGQASLKNLMSPYGRKAFIELVSTYTLLRAADAKKMLESQIHLDNVDSASFAELVEFFNDVNCTSRTEFRIVTFPDPLLVDDICEMDPEDKRMLLFFTFRYLNANGLYAQLQRGASMDAFAAEEQTNVRNYDWTTLDALLRLSGTFAPVITRFSQFSKLNGSELFAAVVYEGLCGIAAKGNKSTFGFDPGTATRFDSLRDRLKDWNPDHHYENDPEISVTCNAMFQNFESIPYTALLWRQIKPFIRGVIYYAPATPLTDAIMDKVERRFAQLQDIEGGINSIIHVIHRGRKWLRTHSGDLNQTILAISKENNFDIFTNMFGISIPEQQKSQILASLKSFTSLDIEKILERFDFIAELLSEVLTCIKYNKTKGFEAEWEAVNAGSELLSAEKLWGVIIFENVKDSDGKPVEPHHLKYKIRMDSDKVDGTRYARDRLTSKTPRRRPVFDLKYITYGFIYLQEMIEQSIIEVETGKDIPPFSTYMQQFPYPCYIYDQFIRAISRTFPLFMVLSWVYASSMIVKSVVLEKELRLREVMKVMGLGNGVIWCGWFIDSFLVMSISATVLTVILKYGKVVENSDITLVWVFMISFTVATINFSFLVSTLFTRANSAAAAGGILFFVSYLPYNMLLMWEEQLSWYQILTSCIVSNVAFGFGCTYFARYEEDGIGAQWDRITLTTLPGDDFNLGFCILMLWVDSLLYWALTWYIEALFPGGSGVPKPWNFFLMRSYWVESKPPEMKMTYEAVSGVNCSENGNCKRPILEPEPEGLTPGVTISHLSKKYSNGKVALEDLSITFYENQITSFLGHNGAGKTTTISILTGLFPPSEGTAKICGLDINKDMDSIRHGTGICPQYNTLFDRLTVEEHMQFYAGLKGKWNDSFEAEFTQMIHDLGIPHKRYDFPKNLSGGMKRKLSVACSFIGGSKTVFLDEPTSGVGKICANENYFGRVCAQYEFGADPYSRRSIWELLLKYKQGRTIILTTHFMDEADILGDRIAIISQGKLKACGSSLFLKSHFGQGYSLRIVKDEASLLDLASARLQNQNGPDPDHQRQPASRRQVEGLAQFVKQNVPNVTLVDDVGSEIVFLLPYTSIQGFPILFQRLDENCKDLGLSSWGISDTTLEDVFLKITLEDVEVTAETFAALDGKCKRRVMQMLRRVKAQFKCKDKKKTKKNKDGSVIAPVVTVNDQAPCNACPHKVSIISDPTIIEASRTRSDGSIGPCHRASVDIEGNLLVCPEDNGSSSANTSLLDEAMLDDDFPARSYEKIYSWWGLACVQIGMIFVKRLLNSNRNKKAMFFEIILPAVFIAITLTFTLILPPATDEPPRELTPWTYESPNVVFFSDKGNHINSTPSFSMFLQGLLGPEFMGTACVADELNRSHCDPKSWSNMSVSNFLESRRSYEGQAFEDCSCQTGSLQCPSSVNRVEPPRLKTPTHDKLYDVSKINIPEWIEKTYRKYETQRYGGFEMQMRDQLPNSVTGFLHLVDQFTEMRLVPKAKIFDNESDAGTDFFSGPTLPDTEPKQDVVFKVWYENRGWVSSVAYLNALHNVLLRETLPNNKNKGEYGITLSTHPMNLTKSQSNKESLKTAGLGVIHAVCVIFALSFVPASFTVYLIEERKNGAKHLHLVSGVKPIMYWIANFLYDLVKYLVPVVLCIILFWLFDAKAYIGRPSILSFICLLLLYGWASIPAMYPFSFFFSIPSTAFVVLACMNLFIGVMSTVSTFVLEQFGDPELERIGDVLKQTFLVFPHYCLGRGLIELVRLDMEAVAFDRLGFSDERDRFEWDHLGKMLFFLALHGLVFFTLNICFEYRQLYYFLFKQVKLPLPKEEQDEDVVKERGRVLNQPDLQTTLRAENLTKYYSGQIHPAVNGLTFAVERGECFGLLGVNGAGKSSTFKMLTGDIRITCGRAMICGSDVETDLDGARRHFGYCPQEDGLDPLLDAYEMLRMYGRLRGMTSFETELAVRKLIQMLGLSRCAKRRCGTYSGGNRRKLSTAIALIGDPDVVFLDEPTSGMDPVSRRKFWKVILRLVRIGKSVVLTSHSMEECEALCSRIAIMVNGQFMCLGSLQHLKNRFGNGYTVTVKCSKENQEGLISRLHSILPSARLDDQHCSQLKFNIAQNDAKLADIFNVMYNLRDEGIIEDYSVSQTTLDDIFVKFASHQTDDMDR